MTLYRAAVYGVHPGLMCVWAPRQEAGTVTPSSRYAGYVFVFKELYLANPFLF
jgi:hypothetical protein